MLPLNTKEIGSRGEEIAKNHLLGLGMSFVSQNYRYKRGEIDLIFKDETNNLLVFVEVKTRKNANYGNPEEFVSENQVQSILTVADQYTLEQEWEGMIRFDIVSILLSDNSIIHQIDAFG